MIDVEGHDFRRVEIHAFAFIEHGQVVLDKRLLEKNTTEAARKNTEN
jgi:hypothetical protein